MWDRREDEEDNIKICRECIEYWKQIESIEGKLKKFREENSLKINSGKTSMIKYYGAIWKV